MSEKGNMNALKHGRSHTSGTYSSWINMKTRCNNKKASGFEHYGGRGIRVCDRWYSFETFLADMGECPAGMSLERKDTNGNYEPGNCRWATRSEQVENRRVTMRATLDGETLTIKQWAARKGINYHTVYARIKALGWSPERALTEAVSFCRRDLRSQA